MFVLHDTISRKFASLVLPHFQGHPTFPVKQSLMPKTSSKQDVISSESLPTFQRKLKRHLLCQLFPGCCYWHLHLQWTLQWQCHLGHSKNTSIDWLIDLHPVSLYATVTEASKWWLYLQPYFWLWKTSFSKSLILLIPSLYRLDKILENYWTVC